MKEKKTKVTEESDENISGRHLLDHPDFKEFLKTKETERKKGKKWWN